ncbi:FecR domain-containing protein [Compostibacter hankyongensis]|uniref:DUF4974 domain-containing protein n=1 Tax=Compostibacter hankyongensis TaxID=1007089 RepID=A0ABP8FT22_9BACT
MKQPDAHFEIAALFGKMLEGSLSPEETARLEAWVAESPENRELWARLSDADYLQKELRSWRAQHSTRTASWKRLARRISPGAVRHHLLRKSLRIAAVALPLLAAAGLGYLMLRDKKTPAPAVAVHTPAPTKDTTGLYPKGKVAQLVLGNGRTLQLGGPDSATIKEADGTQVRNQGNILRYTGADTPDDKIVYNSVITPRGGEYQLVLSDGTKVWMNASSRLRFPIRFSGNERQVFLSGEAYFEVAADAGRPFIVSTDRSDIRVLGTAFNISSYREEATERTTLVTGSVQVRPKGMTPEAILLKPGFQAVLSGNSHGPIVSKANLEETLSWKNGLFVFDSEALESILKKIERWYDVTAEYNAPPGEPLHFTGRIRKYENITSVLHLLELTGKVHFELEGRRLMVIPRGRQP